MYSGAAYVAAIAALRLAIKIKLILKKIDKKDFILVRSL